MRADNHCAGIAPEYALYRVQCGTANHARQKGMAASRGTREKTAQP